MRKLWRPQREPNAFDTPFVAGFSSSRRGCVPRAGAPPWSASARREAAERAAVATAARQESLDIALAAPVVELRSNWGGEEQARGRRAFTPRSQQSLTRRGLPTGSTNLTNRTLRDETSGRGAGGERQNRTVSVSTAFRTDLGLGGDTQKTPRCGTTRNHASDRSAIPCRRCGSRDAWRTPPRRTATRARRCPCPRCTQATGEIVYAV